MQYFIYRVGVWTFVHHLNNKMVKVRYGKKNVPVSSLTKKQLGTLFWKRRPNTRRHKAIVDEIIKREKKR